MQLLVKMAQENPGKVEAPKVQPIERKPVIRRDYRAPQPQEPEQHIWFRALGELGDDPCRHQTILAYMSDFALLGAALLPHPYAGFSKNIQVASLRDEFLEYCETENLDAIIEPADR